MLGRAKRVSLRLASRGWRRSRAGVDRFRAFGEQSQVWGDSGLGFWIVLVRLGAVQGAGWWRSGPPFCFCVFGDQSQVWVAGGLGRFRWFCSA